jgi:hypothetical protein
MAQTFAQRYHVRMAAGICLLAGLALFAVMRSYDPAAAYKKEVDALVQKSEDDLVRMMRANGATPQEISLAVQRSRGQLK